MKSIIVITRMAALVACAMAQGEVTSEDLSEVLHQAEDETDAVQLSEIANHWSPGLDTWEAPEIFVKTLPWYQAGYDDEQRPLFIMELGKWDERKWLEAGGINATNFDKYFEKFWWTCENTPPKDNHPENEDSGFSLIIDWAGYNVRQLASLLVVENKLIQARRAEHIEPHMQNLWIINANFVTQTWMNLIRPIAGRFLGKAEIFGAQKAKFGPVLLSKISKDQLPERYGGIADFKPFKNYGR